MRALTVDWVTFRRSAARLKLPVSAISRKVRRCSMFNGPPGNRETRSFSCEKNSLFNIDSRGRSLAIRSQRPWGTRHVAGNRPRHLLTRRAPSIAVAEPRALPETGTLRRSEPARWSTWPIPRPTPATGRIVRRRAAGRMIKVAWDDGEVVDFPRLVAAQRMRAATVSQPGDPASAPSTISACRRSYARPRSR